MQHEGRGRVGVFKYAERPLSNAVKLALLIAGAQLT